MNVVYAICGTVFWLALAGGLFHLGDEITRYMVLVALFLAALSQFLAQDGGRTVVAIAMGFAYAGMVVTAIALVRTIF